MTIWILALLLFGLLAALGYLQGAIRSAVGLIGVILGVVLAMPLAPRVKPLFPLIGVSNEIWIWLLPPLTVFVLFLIVFTIIAFIVHRQVELHFKYKTNDMQYLRWQRLNQRMGVCLGLVTGAVYLLLFGLIIYITGYVSVQVATADNVPGALKFLNKAREDLQASGLEKTVAKFDRTPPAYYDAADIVGLVYQNPILHSRLSAYPAFISMAQRAEFQDIAGDKDYSEMLLRRESITDVINNPKTQVVLRNSDILQELQQVDLKDLREFLQTGKSAKYDQEKILGRWQLDLNATLAEMRKALPNVSAGDWLNLRKGFTLVLSGMAMTFAPDNRVYIKSRNREEIQKLLEAQAAQAQTQIQAQATPPSPAPRPRGTAATPRSLTARINPTPPQDEAMRQRYNLRPSTPQAAAPAPAPAQTAPLPKINFPGEGTWKNEGDKYTITVQQDGKDHSVQGTIQAESLILSQSGMAIVFAKE